MGGDDGFTGLPDQIAAGRVALLFTNRTETGEAHELVLVRRNDGTDEPVDQLLALPEDQVPNKITPVGVAYGETPRAASAVLLDLEPGRYIAACMIPSDGATGGATHAMNGMVAEFEVT